MIMPWNRREVYVGTSNEKFNEILDTLALHKIRYDYCVVNHDAFGITVMRYIYVHRKDMDRLPRL